MTNDPDGFCPKGCGKKLPSHAGNRARHIEACKGPRRGRGRPAKPPLDHEEMQLCRDILAGKLLHWGRTWTAAATTISIWRGAFAYPEGSAEREARLVSRVWVRQQMGLAKTTANKPRPRLPAQICPKGCGRFLPNTRFNRQEHLDACRGPDASGRRQEVLLGR